MLGAIEVMQGLSNLSQIIIMLLIIIAALLMMLADRI